LETLAAWGEAGIAEETLADWGAAAIAVVTSFLDEVAADLGDTQFADLGDAQSESRVRK
jgi:hypothetical protein